MTTVEKQKYVSL